ncbi:MAG: chorismate mutase [Candidatus Thorarchaeota archaeon]
MKESINFMKKLELLREEINKIDDQMIDLLNKRGKLSKKIGNLKNVISMDTLQPQREDEIINRMKAKSKVLDDTSIQTIWKEIMDACKIIQEI